MDLESLKILMCEIPQFDRLNSSEFDIMSNHIEFRKESAGTTIVEEGTFGDSLFFIVKGLIEIKKESMSGQQTVLARFGKGSTVGEMSLVEENSPRSATATAIEDSEFLILSREKFIEIEERHPKMAVKILRNIASSIGARLRHTSGRFSDIFQ